MGDFETEIGWASWNTADCNSSMNSSSEDRFASELAPLLSVISISVRIGSMRPLRFFRFDISLCSRSSSVSDLFVSSEKVLPTGDFGARVAFVLLVERRGSLVISETVASALRS
jgi:hypothetical protein